MKSRKRRYRQRVSHERWLVSYADFITLLFAFFVVMYSTAQVDKKKTTQLSAAIQTAFQQMGANPKAVNPATLREVIQTPATLPPDSAALDALKSALHQAFVDEIARGEVMVRYGPDGLVVSLQEGGFFDSGSSGIKPGAQQALDRMASLLLQSGYHIRIEGHTDNVPIHNPQFSSNWELSTARATEMIRLLVGKYGFSPQILSAAGYGEFHPVAPNATNGGRALNRRVDVVILAQPAPAASIKPSPNRPLAPPDALPR